jgi:NifU-like protein involved in Fe-S cluster formation
MPTPAAARSKRRSLLDIPIGCLALTPIAAQAHTSAMTLGELYHKEVLRLAARATGAGRLASAGATVKRNNPICGDQVTVDVACEKGQLLRIGFEVKACVLCQASASILGEAAPGETTQSLSALAHDLGAMLKEGAAPPSGRFAAYSALAPVAAHPSRHNCVLLPVESLLEALMLCAAR